MCQGGVGWGDQSRSIRRARMTVTRDSLLRWDGEKAVCSFSFLFPIFAVVVDFFFSVFTVNIFWNLSIFLLFHFHNHHHRLPVSEGELLFRRAELIQTPVKRRKMLISVELLTKCVVITYIFGSVREKFIFGILRSLTSFGRCFQNFDRKCWPEKSVTKHGFFFWAQRKPNA